jgi:hypothetical protein
VLGEQIAEFRGKMIGQRVLPPDGTGPKMEYTFQLEGRLLGVEATLMMTGIGSMASPGHLHAEGHGMAMTREGDGAIGTTIAVVNLAGAGGVAGTTRGAIMFRTQSPKLARLNGVIGLFEAEQDRQGDIQVKVWEWK